MAFVELVAGDGLSDAAKTTAASTAAAFELLLAGGRTLRVPADFEADALRRLLTVLEAA